MSLDFHTVSSAETVDRDDIGTHQDWRERAITVVATTIAVLIVAVIAVLMGMT